LDDNGIEYFSVDVDLTTGEERQVLLDEVRKLNPNCSFPTIVIGDTVVVGYKEALIREALGL
jgi:glutaredoxin